MEPFGSLPLEARGMDLFPLMSMWGSGGEKRITRWHCFNWQEGKQGRQKKKKKMFCNVLPARQQAEHRLFWELFQFNYFGRLKVTPPHRRAHVKFIPLDRRRHRQLDSDVTPPPSVTGGSVNI